MRWRRTCVASLGSCGLVWSAAVLCRFGFSFFSFLFLTADTGIEDKQEPKQERQSKAPPHSRPNPPLIPCPAPGGGPPTRRLTGRAQEGRISPHPEEQRPAHPFPA